MLTICTTHKDFRSQLDIFAKAETKILSIYHSCNNELFKSWDHYTQKLLNKSIYLGFTTIYKASSAYPMVIQVHTGEAVFYAVVTREHFQSVED